MSDCNSASGCGSCPSAEKCAPNEQQAHTEKLVREKLSKIKHKIMVMSGKGGVGKSTVSVSLASALHDRGYKVGIIDADIHGPNIPKMFGIKDKGIKGTDEGMHPHEPKEGLKVMSVGFLVQNDDDAVIWRSPVKHGLIEQFVSEVLWGELDYLIIDLPPGTGDEPLSVAHTIKDVDGSVIVTTPQDVALLDSRKSVTFSNKLKVPVFGIVENMSGLICPHCAESIDLFKTGGGEKAAGELQVNFLGRVPIDPKVVEHGDAGNPYVIADKDSEVAKAFNRIAEQIETATIKK